MLEERMTQVEVAVAQHTDLFSRFAAVSENLTTALSGISQRLDRIEARLTNVEADLAILKGWLGPSSENGN